MLERRPLYEQVRQQVLDYVSERHLMPGDIIPTEAELAVRYGVSVGTVRRALLQLVDQGILYRQPGRGTFLTEQSHQKARQRGILACIMPYIRDAFAATLIAGAQYATQEADYVLQLYNSQGRAELEEELLQESAGSADGVLLLPVARTTISPFAEELLHRRFPLVFADRFPAPGANHVSYVVSDNRRGAYAATQHLLEMGHRRIGLALTPDAEVNSSVAQRIEGYHQALQEHDLSPEEALIVKAATSRYGSSDPLSSRGSEATANITLFQGFLQQARPSGVFAVNDLAAMEVWRAAEGLGWSVPQDISIVGFDDADFLYDLHIPLTTVAQDSFGTGQKAVEILLQFIEGRSGAARRMVLPTHLVIRSSTGPYTAT
jgi:DNA-binding LacI/PurR family transcriptional regulator